MRTGMNICIMLGRLTRDFDVNLIGNNKKVLARSAIAVNRYYTNVLGEEKTETCYIEIEAWERVGESMVRNFQKGDIVLLRGRIRLNEWIDRATKEKKKKHILYVEMYNNVKETHGTPDGNTETILPDTT